MKLQCCILTVFGIFVTGVQADEVDDFVQARMKEHHVPGAALAILRDGKLVKEAYYGNVMLEHDVPVTKNTVFRLASITKAVTSIAVLMLYEQGKVDLDASISDYLTDIPDEWSSITVRHLLSQTGGIQRTDEAYVDVIREYPEEFLKCYRALEYNEFIQLEPARRSPLAHEPGSGWGYSDFHHAFAGKILQNVAGVALADLVRREILVPLDVSSAMFPTSSDTIIPNFAKTYQLDRSHRIVPQPAYLNSVPAIPGAFGLYSNLRDMVKLETALHEGRLLKPETRDLMLTPAKSNSGEPAPAEFFNEKPTKYGLGWFLHGTEEHPIALVPGITGTVWIRLPKDDIAIIYLSNRRGGDVVAVRHLVQFLVPELKGHTY